MTGLVGLSGLSGLSEGNEVNIMQRDMNEQDTCNNELESYRHEPVELGEVDAHGTALKFLFVVQVLLIMTISVNIFSFFSSAVDRFFFSHRARR
ncbi:MAG: hypothetical protein PHQ75_03550 [Thermoguttaceae bacterium]|nr:hypothetical protein [Thermoguttaceae bacterium]